MDILKCLVAIILLCLQSLQSFALGVFAELILPHVASDHDDKDQRQREENTECPFDDSKKDDHGLVKG
jgi:hypothetical protein